MQKYEAFILQTVQTGRIYIGMFFMHIPLDYKTGGHIWFAIVNIIVSSTH